MQIEGVGTSDDNFFSDQSLLGFMGAQPVLQWLDSDLSALDDPWAGFEDLNS